MSHLAVSLSVCQRDDEANLVKAQTIIDYYLHRLNIPLSHSNYLTLNLPVGLQGLAINNVNSSQTSINAYNQRNTNYSLQ